MLALGVYPKVKLGAAREARDTARKLLAGGIDPALQRKQDKRESRLKVENSFEAIARDWHRQQSGRWTADHAARVLESLEKDIFKPIGQRPVAELRAGRWIELDEGAGLWRVPAERMKMSEAHLVPLSRQALVVLDELRPFSGHYALMFPNRNKITRCLSENTMTYALYRMGRKSRATAHGFRSTASTILNESGFNPDAIERQLAHRERNKVRAAYHRAEYLDERRRMMQWWGDFVDRQRAIGRGENVVAIHRTP